MAKVGNWPAVERSFVRLEAMGFPHTFKVLVNAAYSAREIGDIALAKERLHAARTLEADKAVDEWLWSIQQEYAPLMVAADLTDNYRLIPGAMPFSPEHRRAVEFAVEKVEEDGRFDGLLPKGTYTFEPFDESAPRPSFTFDLTHERPSVDLRTHPGPTKRDRRKRARIDKKMAREQGG